MYELLQVNSYKYEDEKLSAYIHHVYFDIKYKLDNNNTVTGVGQQILQ